MWNPDKKIMKSFLAMGCLALIFELELRAARAQNSSLQNTATDKATENYPGLS